MALPKYNGDWNKPYMDGPPRLFYPFDGDNNSFFFEGDYVQRIGYFKPAPLTTPWTPNPASGGRSTPLQIESELRKAILVSETPIQPIGGDIVKWTRTYSVRPADRDEWEQVVYEFPGYQACAGGESEYATVCVIDAARDVFPSTVPCRVRHEYFVIGKTLDANTLPPTPISDPSGIPTIEGQRFWATSDEQTPVSGKILTTVSSPTKGAWISKVGAATKTLREFVMEDSTIERWMGPIWVRKTRYIEAK